MDKKRNIELENWLIETTGEEMMANHLGPNWNRFHEECGFYPNISMTIADQVWEHKQKRIDEINQENEKLKLDHAAYKKGVKNIIREKLKQVEGRDFTIAAMERSFVLANAKVDELQARLDELTSIATELAEYASYAEIVGGVTVNRAAVRSFCDKVFDFNRKSDDQYIEQALKGGESK